MRRIWAGINASDINFTAGRYFGSVKESEKRLPFNAGFEAVGIVAAVGEGVSGAQAFTVAASVFPDTRPCTRWHAGAKAEPNQCSRHRHLCIARHSVPCL